MKIADSLLNIFGHYDQFILSDLQAKISLHLDNK